MGSSATRRLPARGLLAAILLSAPLLLDIAASAGDICELPPDAGPCDGVCPRWFFNARNSQCEPFIWGCCGGNANNFVNRLQCQASCACSLPVDPGPCDGSCPRWFFNAESGACEEFIWGCCGGNANNYQTLSDCQAACANACPADVTFDGVVDVEDMVSVIVAWGVAGGPADVNDDGIVSVQDLVGVILAWGDCP